MENEIKPSGCETDWLLEQFKEKAPVAYIPEWADFLGEVAGRLKRLSQLVASLEELTLERRVTDLYLEYRYNDPVGGRSAEDAYDAALDDLKSILMDVESKTEGDSQ